MDLLGLAFVNQQKDVCKSSAMKRESASWRLLIHVDMKTVYR